LISRERARLDGGNNRLVDRRLSALSVVTRQCRRITFGIHDRMDNLRRPHWALGSMSDQPNRLAPIKPRLARALLS
jgi:hypothetical protein